MASTLDEIRSFCETPAGPYRRPFSSLGGQTTCDVVIVGTNPATPLRDEFPSFDSYWSSLLGDGGLFNEVYLRSRSGTPSKTSRWVERIVQGLPEGTRTVKTNATWFPCSKASQIPPAERRNSWPHLHALLDLLQPQIILAHGRPACDALHAILSIPVRPSVEASRTPIRQDSTWVIGFPHLSGAGIPAGQPGVGDQTVDELVQRICGLLRNRSPG